MKRKRYFQWLDGEYKGDVVVLDNISELDGEVFYNFEDGEACNLRFISKMTNNIVDLKGKFMVEVENPGNAWTFGVNETSMPQGIKADSDDVIPTLHDFLNSNAGAGASQAEINDSDFGKDKLIPPKKRQNLCPLPDIEEYREVLESPVEKKPAQQEQKAMEEPIQTVLQQEEENKPVQKIEKKVSPLDPVAILVDTCKKHPTEIPITLTIDLPVKTLYYIAESEFENGGQKFVDYIVEGLDTKKIVEAIRLSLFGAYGVGIAENIVSNDE